MKSVDLSSSSSFRTSNTSTLTCSTAMSSKPSDGSLRISQNSHCGPQQRRVSKSYITSLIRGFDDAGNQLHCDSDDDDEHDDSASGSTGTNVSQVLQNEGSAVNPPNADATPAHRPRKWNPIRRHCSTEDITSHHTRGGRRPSQTMTYSEFRSRRRISIDHAPLSREPSFRYLGGSDLANSSIKILSSNSNSNSKHSAANANPDADSSPFAIPPYHLLRRRSSFTTPSTHSSCIVFVDLEGYSKNTDLTQRHVTRDFMETLRNILTFAYGRLPDRECVDEYVILPTGDGAAVCVLKPPGSIDASGGVEEARGSLCGRAGDEEWDYDDLLSKHSQFSSDSSVHSTPEPSQRHSHCSHGSRPPRHATRNRRNHNQRCSSPTGLRSIEETALWIGSSLLLWAKHRSIGLRVGLNSGDLSIVQDPYGDPNVCGDAINMAARIMDTAMPGQILVCSSTVVPKLNLLRMEDGKLMGESMKTVVDGMDDGPWRSQRERGGSIYSVSGTRRASSGVHSRRGRSDSCWSSRRSSCPDEGSVNEGECREHPHMKYTISSSPIEVVVKHGVTTNVQSVRTTLYFLPTVKDLPLEARLELEMLDTMSRGNASSIAKRPSSSSTSSSSSSLDEMHQEHVKVSRTDATTPINSVEVVVDNNSIQERDEINREEEFGKQLQRLQLNLQTNDTTCAPPPTASKPLPQSHLPRRQSKKASLRAVEPTTSTTETVATTVKNAVVPPPPRPRPPERQYSTLAQRRQSKIYSMEAKPLELPYEAHEVGVHETPVTKWYLKIKPAELKSDYESNQIKPKVLPQDLIRRHRRISFIGIMHDNLSKTFLKVIEKEPKHTWDKIYIFFPSDNCIKYSLARNYPDQPYENLIEQKHKSQKSLQEVLGRKVHDLRFLQYSNLMHCGSYWDWDQPGGFIHVSPLTWGQSAKTCPAMNYYWNSKVPSNEYRVYREGLEYLLENAKPFGNDDGVELGVKVRNDDLDGVVQECSC